MQTYFWAEAQDLQRWTNPIELIQLIPKLLSYDLSKGLLEIANAWQHNDNNMRQPMTAVLTEWLVELYIEWLDYLKMY